MDGVGHINASIGLAQALARRGHQVIFLVNEVHREKFIELGFGENLLYLNVSKVTEPNPVKLTAEQFKRNGLLSGASSFEKMKCHNVGENNFLHTLVEKLAHFDGQIAIAIEREHPDVIIVNQFLIPPAILRAHIPWIYQYPCNPLGLYRSDKLPPLNSGKSWV